MADNYLLQAAQAKARFLTYDQNAIIQKLSLKSDEDYLYIPMLSRLYRVSRASGDIEKQVQGLWEDGNSHGEVMTLLDLLCDSKWGRHLSGHLKSMSDFGLMFHQNLLENAKNPWAQLFQEQLAQFHKACRALNGQKLSMGDAAYAIELFDGLSIVVQLWLGDEEFPPNLRFLWDENALDYIRYETMYFAKGMLLERIREEM